jgi:hypothetical protein
VSDSIASKQNAQTTTKQYPRKNSIILTRIAEEQGRCAYSTEIEVHEKGKEPEVQYESGSVRHVRQSRYVINPKTQPRI